MKTVAKIVVCMTAMALLSACAGNMNIVVKAGESSRRDVFTEVSASTASSGKALLKIDFRVKNIKSRIVNTYIKHSDPPYTVLVNVDGQSALLSNEPVLEDLQDDFMKNPEAGTGWRYNFRRELLLEPGKHHVTIVVPLSDVTVEKDVTLEAGNNLLQLFPEYNASVSRYPDYPRFNHGLRSMAVKLNNMVL